MRFYDDFAKNLPQIQKSSIGRTVGGLFFSKKMEDLVDKLCDGL